MEPYNTGNGYIADEITPHDTNELPKYTKAIYVGGTGNITLTCVDDTEVVFATIPAGTILPVRAKIIKSTGTTATTLVAMY